MRNEARSYTKRKVDQQATLVAYTNSLLSIRHELFEPIHGCWLSSYDTWDSFTRCQLIEDELELRRFTELDNNVLVLFQVCVLRGIDVLGITSERLIQGEFIAAVPIEGGRVNCDIIYVGGHNAFANKKRHSSFSVYKQDRRYVCQKTFNHSNAVCNKPDPRCQAFQFTPFPAKVRTSRPLAVLLHVVSKHISRFQTRSNVR